MTFAAATLEDWTFDLVERLCATGQVETSQHDFKIALPSAENLTKICCAFANSDGGFVVVGVRNLDNGEGFVPEGITPNTEIAADFGNKVQADPTIFFSAPRAISVPKSDRSIFVFQVPRSERRPHLPTDATKRFFWKRTNAGNVRMTLEEIRAMFLDYEGRRQLLVLLTAELVAIEADLILLSILGDSGVPVIRPDASTLSDLIPQIYPLVSDDQDFLRVLVDLRRLVKTAAGEEQLFLDRVVANTIDWKILLESHKRNMLSRGKIGLALTRIALARLKSEYEIDRPFTHGQPFLNITEEMMADEQRVKDTITEHFSQTDPDGNPQR